MMSLVYYTVCVYNNGDNYYIHTRWTEYIVLTIITFYLSFYFLSITHIFPSVIDSWTALNVCVNSPSEGSVKSYLILSYLILSFLIFLPLTSCCMAKYCSNSQNFNWDYVEIPNFSQMASMFGWILRTKRIKNNKKNVFQQKKKKVPSLNISDTQCSQTGVVFGLFHHKS